MTSTCWLPHFLQQPIGPSPERPWDFCVHLGNPNEPSRRGPWSLAPAMPKGSGQRECLAGARDLIHKSHSHLRPWSTGHRVCLPCRPFPLLAGTRPAQQPIRNSMQDARCFGGSRSCQLEFGCLSPPACTLPTCSRSAFAQKATTSVLKIENCLVDSWVLVKCQLQKWVFKKEHRKIMLDDFSKFLCQKFMLKNNSTIIMWTKQTSNP